MGTGDCKHYLDHVFKSEDDNRSWVDSYSKYLETGVKQKGYNPGADKHIVRYYDPYDDIDAVYNGRVRVPEYYSDLTGFLNVRMKDQRFNKPLFGEGVPKDRSITFDDLALTSDSFGFSAPGGNENHPLDKLLSYSKHYTDVADYLYDTRTIGGAFIWPKIKVHTSRGSAWRSVFNQNRGVKGHNLGSYINDRVDLTLQEIKMFYQYCENNGSDKELIDAMRKDGYVILKGTDAGAICEWLQCFGSFNGFIDFFCFYDFVVDKNCCPINESTKNYELFPINIASEEEKSILKMESICGQSQADFMKHFMKQCISEYDEVLNDEQRLMGMLERVRSMITARTKSMEDNIRGT